MKVLEMIALSLFSLALSAQSFNAAPNLATGNTGIAREGTYSLSTNRVYDRARHSKVRSGVEYRFDRRLMLRDNAASNPWSYFAGAGLPLQRLALDVASSFRPKLIPFHRFTISYAF